MTTLTAVSTDNLATMLAEAQDGDTIQLAAGSYEQATISGAWKNNVNVLPAPDAVGRVVVANLHVVNSSGIRFAGIECVGTPGVNPVVVDQGNSIILDDLQVHGSLDEAGIFLNQSAACKVRKCRLDELHTGIFHMDCQGLDVLDNDFWDITHDGISGGASEHGSFAAINMFKNRFKDFAPADGVNCAAIRIFNFSTAAPNSGVVAAHNDIRRGDGGAIDGIIIENQSGIKHKKVFVTSNMCMGGGWNGIQVNGCEGPQVDYNFAQADGSLDANGFDMAQWIAVFGCEGGTINGNMATAVFQSPPEKNGFMWNVTIPAALPGDYSLADRWAADTLPAPQSDDDENELRMCIALMAAVLSDHTGTLKNIGVGRNMLTKALAAYKASHT